MPERLLKILFRTYNGMFLVTGLLVILFAGAFYLLLGKQAADTLTEQMLHREQLAARAGAVSLGVFVDGLSNNLSAYSTRPYIESFDPKKAQSDMEIFLESWRKTSVSGIILADASGNVKFGVDRQGSTGKGVNVADREYFKWAKTAKEDDRFVGEVIQSNIGFARGRFIVPIASPVVEDGQFRGVLVTSFLLDEAKAEYMDPLKITDKTRIYLISQHGIILSGSVPKLIGVNYLDYLKKSGISGGKKMAEILAGALSSGKEDKLDIALPDETKNGALTRYLIAYAPVMVGNDNWVLGVATPATDALMFLAPFYFKNLILAGIAFFAFLIIAIRVSKIRGYVEAVETEHKIHNIKEKRARLA